jgi:hypothetical protein
LGSMGRTGFGWLRIGSSGGHGNEPSVSTKNVGYSLKG